MKRPSGIVIATFAFIILCLIAVFYLSQPRFQGHPQSPQKQQETTQQPLPDLTETKRSPGTRNDTAFCLGGCPQGMPARDKIVVHHILELSNNPETKFADWVAYKISEDMLGKGCKRIWEVDPDLDPETTLRPSDYTGIRAALASDRGHQAPLASLCGSPYWQEADYLSNITPQKSELNEGVWEHLEDHERKLVEEGYARAVYSLTGPLYEREMPSLPQAHEEHRVPSGYWKVITMEADGGLEAAAFIMDQDSGRDDDYCDKKVSLDDLESRSHLQFFPGLTQDDKVKLGRRQNAIMENLGCH